MTAERGEALRAGRPYVRADTGAPLRRSRAILAPELPASTRRSPARSRRRPGGSTECAGQAALRRESSQGDCLQIPPAAVPSCSRPRGAPDGGFWPRRSHSRRPPSLASRNILRTSVDAVSLSWTRKQSFQSRFLPFPCPCLFLASIWA